MRGRLRPVSNLVDSAGNASATLTVRPASERSRRTRNTRWRRSAVMIGLCTAPNSFGYACTRDGTSLLWWYRLPACTTNPTCDASTEPTTAEG